MTEEPTGLGISAPSTPSLPSTSEGAGPASSGEQSVSLFNTSAPAPSPSPVPAPAASTDEAPAGVSQAAWDAMPKSWRKEMEAHWTGLTPDVRKYVHEREQQAFRGIQQYSRGNENWTKLVKPYEEVLAQNPDIDPVEMMSGLARNHLILTRGTPEQKRQLFQAMQQHYGLADAPAGSAPATPFTPEQLAFLQKTLSPVVQHTQASLAEARARRLSEATSAVDKFFSDPQNEFAEDVGQDMLEILKKGQTTDLPEAYELAIMRNPEVKARYLAALAAKSAPAGQRAQPLNVQSSTTPASAPRPGTMDETMKAIVKKHYG